MFIFYRKRRLGENACNYRNRLGRRRGKGARSLGIHQKWIGPRHAARHIGLESDFPKAEAVHPVGDKPADIKRFFRAHAFYSAVTLTWFSARIHSEAPMVNR